MKIAFSYVPEDAVAGDSRERILERLLGARLEHEPLS
jgi:hypothetical protein